MIHLIDPSSYQEGYTTIRYVILEFIRVQCYTRFREQKWLVFLKCSLTTIYKCKTCIEKLFCFLIEKYYNTPASYACANQVPTETLIVVKLL